MLEVMGVHGRPYPLTPHALTEGRIELRINWLPTHTQPWEMVALYTASQAVAMP